ncbi:MAPEG family protein [Sulfitobacter sp. F26204]|uniref:MAPEG family protein n=1 Tax=Sulfitobacter sp. F26204 TaxID=2996014 RepID=UPI00225E3AB3|nr:MAPEG family protein [Sulfitobacter sp. F26204]MCX7559176.1 MAPEG family protein [Sulfitobacter sp. F26204]
MDAFPTELGILACLSLFAASLWLPYVVGAARQTETGGTLDPFQRPADLRQLPAWVHRAHRAHLNLLEQFLPFAVLVLIVDRVDGFGTLTYWTAIVYFWVRVAHAIGMISGMARMPLRPMLHNIGWVCCLLMGYAVFVAGLAQPLT